MAKLADLEKAQLVAKGEASGVRNWTPEEDEGTDRALELIERLLDEANQSASEVLSKEGRCMTCGRPVNGAG
jgi:hypothetical protein